MKKLYIWIPILLLSALAICSYLLIERDVSWLNDTMPYSWSEIFWGGSNGFYATLKWIIAIYAITLINIPLTIWLFQKLPDRGWILGRGLGLVIAVAIAWNLSVYRVIDFRKGVWLSVAILVLLNLIVFWFLLRKDWDKYKSISIKPALISEIVFIIAFIFMFVIRLNIPEIYSEDPFVSGNKPTALSVLTSSVRSPFMPVMDTFLSGSYINSYYYYGYVYIAWLIHITGIEPEITWNLAVPLLFAMFVGFGFSAGFNMVCLTVTKAKLQWIGGFSAAIFSVFMIGIYPLMHFVYAYVNNLLTVPLFPFASYFEANGIETPIIKNLLGELHPNSMSLPFIILTLCICIMIIASRKTDSSSLKVSLLVLLGLCVSTISWINMWDATAVVFIAIGTIIISGFHTHGFSIKWVLFSSCLFMLAFYALLSPFFIQFEGSGRGIYFESLYSIKPLTIVLYYIVPFISLIPFIFGSSFRRLHEKILNKSINPLLILFFIAIVVIILFLLLILPGKLGTLLFTIFLGCFLMFHLQHLNIFRFNAKIHMFVCVLILYSIITFAMVNIVSVNETDIYGIGYPESNSNTLNKFYSPPTVFLALAAAWGCAFYWNIGRWFRIPILVIMCISIIYGGFLIENRIALGLDKTGLGINGFASIEQDSLYVYKSLIIETASMHEAMITNDPSFSFNWKGSSALSQIESREIYGDPKPGDRTVGMYALDRESTRALIAYVPMDSVNEMSAINWLKINIPADSIIMENYSFNSLFFFNGAQVAAITGFRSVLGEEIMRTERRIQTGDRAEIQQRTDDITAIYTSRNLYDARTIKEILCKYSVDYLYFGESERSHFGENANYVFQSMTDNLNLVFQSGNIYIYEVDLVGNCKDNVYDSSVINIETRLRYSS